MYETPEEIAKLGEPDPEFAEVCYICQRSYSLPESFELTIDPATCQHATTKLRDLISCGSSLAPAKLRW
jgi:hypothetical protein